jgi:peptidoglycan/LPS O-acetylase OafA/YrhL
MKNNNFDFLRFFFAFVVILEHIYNLTINNEVLAAGKYVDSFIAVSGFFIISGFLITISYSRASGPKDYLVKRGRRILPAYLFVIVFFSVVLSIASTLSFKQYFGSGSFYQYLGANLLFLNFLHPCLPGVFESNYMCAVDGSLWTLKVEVSFYLVLPLIFYLIKIIPQKGLVLAVLYCLSLLWSFLLGRYFQIHPNPGLYFTLSHQLPSLMPYFIAGMALYFYFDKVLRHKTTLMLIALPIYLAEYYFDYQVLRPVALALIIFYIAYSFSFLNNFGRYGDFSYGIYIFHFPVIQLFVYYGIYKNYPAWLSVSLTLLISVLLGVLSWNFIEKKFLTKARVRHYTT